MGDKFLSAVTTGFVNSGDKIRGSIRCVVEAALGYMTGPTDSIVLDIVKHPRRRRRRKIVAGGTFWQDHNGPSPF